jgi:hypothetical protein
METTKKHRTVGFPAENRTEHLPNTSLRVFPLDQPGLLNMPDELRITSPHLVFLRRLNCEILYGGKCSRMGKTKAACTVFVSKIRGKRSAPTRISRLGRQVDFIQ